MKSCTLLLVPFQKQMHKVDVGAGAHTGVGGECILIYVLKKNIYIFFSHTHFLFHIVQ